MRIPTETAEVLSHYIPTWAMQGIDVQFQPLALAPCGCGALLGPRALKTVGTTPGPDQILIDESRLPLIWSTPEGIALVAHELVHVEQWRTIPDFARKYSQAEEERIRLGLDPWDNIYEAPAYDMEHRVREDLERPNPGGKIYELSAINFM